MDKETNADIRNKLQRAVSTLERIEQGNSVTQAHAKVVIEDLKKGLDSIKVDDELNNLEVRIKELGDKSSQTLLFLSFALVVLATLKDKYHGLPHNMNEAMWWWSVALLPILIGILPLKEHHEKDIIWYKKLRCLKVVLLVISISTIICGVCRFLDWPIEVAILIFAVMLVTLRRN